MQTRQLLAGDTLLLEEEKSFCLVVDGLVQVFVKSPPPRLSQTLDDEDEEWEGGQGYQLLTEAKNGGTLRPTHKKLTGLAPLSSLFTILSLFTEDINLPSPPYSTAQSMHHETATNTELVPYEAPPNFHLNEPLSSPTFPSPPHRNYSSVHPDIVARATVDSTIAIIPAEAFRRLVRIYPKASAHIVQVILTRFQRVTFLTGHKYLGLTAEILKTEKMLNTKGTYELPNILRRGVLEKLKEQYLARADEGEEDSSGVILTHARVSGVRRRSNVGGVRPRVNSASIHTSTGFMANAARRAAAERQRRDPGPGDILSSVPTHMASSPIFESGPAIKPTRPSPPSRTASTSPIDVEKNDESEFRDAVMDCMFKAIGLAAVEPTLTATTAVTGSSSIPASPRLVSYDSVRQKAVFTNSPNISLPAFGHHAFPLPNGSQSSVQEDEERSVASSMLSIQDELENEVEVVYFRAGTILVDQEERTPGLYYVIDGFLETCLVLEEEKSEEVTETHAGGIKQDIRTAAKPTGEPQTEPLFLVKPGGLAGYLGSISGFPSFCQIRAKTDVLVGFLPRSSLERIMEKQPVVLLTMAKRLISLLSPLVLHIDFALEWIQVNAGQVIYHANDPSDAIYIVLNGRVRTLTANHEVVGEYGRGESVGELEVLTDQKRGSTLHAIRDTELARFPKTLFNTLALEHPRISMQIYKMIANRLKAPTTLSPARHTFNLRTVGILPVRQGIPIIEFAKSLQKGIAAGVGVGCQLLNQERVLENLGRHAFNRMGKLKLTGYLAELEEKWDMVLYVADTGVNSPWTQTCISQVRLFFSMLMSGGLYFDSGTGG
jgi:CRP-like cAMP-binding protein